MTNDFDFIVGKWTVLNRRLKERLCACEEWVEFEATYKSFHILGGLGNSDEMKSGHGDDAFYGLSMRMYNPAKKEWTIYWADSDHPENGIKPQVVGTFEDKKGIFFGEELYKGKMMQLRFIWTSVNENLAVWEQAYYDEQREEWEVNWTMEFRRAQ